MAVKMAAAGIKTDRCKTKTNSVITKTKHGVIRTEVRTPITEE